MVFPCERNKNHQETNFLAATMSFLFSCSSRPLGQVNLSVQRNQLLLHTRSQRIPANKKKRRREKKRKKEKTQHTLAQKRDKPCVFARTALATNDQTKSRLSGSHVRGQHTYQQTQSQQRDRGAVLHHRRKKNSLKAKRRGCSARAGPVRQTGD